MPSLRIGTSYARKFWLPRTPPSLIGSSPERVWMQVCMGTRDKIAKVTKITKNSTVDVPNSKTDWDDIHHEVHVLYVLSIKSRKYHQNQNKIRSRPTSMVFLTRMPLYQEHDWKRKKNTKWVVLRLFLVDLGVCLEQELKSRCVYLASSFICAPSPCVCIAPALPCLPHVISYVLQPASWKMTYYR